MKPVQLLCDARSTPPRVAAVLLIDGCCEYADMEPQTHTMEQFKRRGDNQIASLELLSIAFGLSTFEEKLRGRNIVVHSENTTAENGVRKGRARYNSLHVFVNTARSEMSFCLRARTFDHTCIVRIIWSKLWDMGCGMYVVRVPSKENMADDPSA